MQPPPELAAAAVHALVHYLSLATEEASKRVGSAVVERLAGLYRRVKARLTSPADKDALASLENAPTDPDAQGALRLAIKRVLIGDTAFGAELADLLTELRSAGFAAVVQTSAITGDRNLNVQIAGNANQVGGFDKVS
jgi:hypothetical protein